MRQRLLLELLGEAHCFIQEQKYCFKTRFDFCNLHIFTLKNKEYMFRLLSDR